MAKIDERANGWHLLRLSDICRQDRRIVEPNSSEANSLPYLSLEHIEPDSGRILKTPGAKTEDEGKSTTFYFDEHHVLYGKLRPDLNKVALPGFSGRCTTEIIPLLPTNGTDREYLSWALRRKETVEFAMAGRTGSRMPRADMDQFLRLPIPLPEIQEQLGIAAFLRDKMATIENLRAATQERLKAAVALLASHLKDTFTGEGARKWPTVGLGEVTDIVSGITLGRRLNNGVTRKVPYLRVANVKDGQLDLCDVYEIEATEKEIRKLGRGTCWQQELPECIHQNHIFRVRLNRDRFVPEFVEAQIGSSYGKRYFSFHAKQTTGIATINQKVLRAFPLLAPPRDEQIRVVKELSERMGIAGDAVRLAREEHGAIEALPAQLLHSAFEGDL